DTDRQRRKAVDAFRVAHLGPRKSGGRALRHHGRSGDGRALLIDDPAGDGARGLLRERRRAGEQQNYGCSKQLPSHSRRLPKNVQITTVSVTEQRANAATVCKRNTTVYLLLCDTGTPVFA